MNRARRSQVRDHFTSSSRDMTPQSARDSCHVLFAPVSCDPGVTRDCASVLSDTELDRSERFGNEHDKTLFIQRRAFRRFCGATVLDSPRSLTLVEFQQTANGRPILPGAPDTWFSFSSCPFGFLAAWSTSHGLGVDIEDQTRNLDAEELARHYFSEAEANAVSAVSGQERLQTFFQFWSLKEAALKSIGEGLPFGLDAFRFELCEHQRVVQAPYLYGGEDMFSAFLIEGTGHCAALVTRSLT